VAHAAATCLSGKCWDAPVKAAEQVFDLTRAK
jgi:hypothetical protein